MSSITHSFQLPMKNDTEVLVVGGGPVGLWTAIQAKVLSGRKVTVVEKYEVYQRADIHLTVKKSSTSGIPAHKALHTEIKNWFGRPYSIKNMEEGLTKIAHEVGVRIIKGYTADPKKLTDDFPEAKVIVGADGARSAMRKEISGDHFRFNTTLQHVIQVQYVVNYKPKEELEETSLKRQVRKIQEQAETYSMQKFAESLIIQNIRHQEDGSSKVTLQIFVDKETYDQMSDASFKTPYYFETDLNKIPHSLRETLIKWWGARETLYGEVIIAEQEKINKMTVIALGCSCAKESMQVDENGVVKVLVGDALETFPYFRSINNGFILGTKLAKCIASAFEQLEKTKDSTKAKKSFTASFNSYWYYAIYRGYVERIKAYVKNLFVGLSSVWIKLSNLVPWQSIKLNRRQKDLAYRKGVAIWEKLSGSHVPSPVYDKSFLSASSPQDIGSNCILLT